MRTRVTVAVGAAVTFLLGGLLMGPATSTAAPAADPCTSLYKTSPTNTQLQAYMKCRFDGGPAVVVTPTPTPTPSATQTPTVAPTVTPTPSTSPTAAPKVTETHTATTITLTWQATAGATGYQVGRDGVDDSGYGAYETTDPASARSRTFDHLVPGATYHVFQQPVPSGARTTLTVKTTSSSPSPSPTVSPTPTVTPPKTASPTPSPSKSPTQAPGDTTTWLSGASSAFGADGSFGTWRGSPVEIWGTWVNDPALYTFDSEAAAYTGAIDVGVVPPEWRGWSAEASGTHDAFWTSMADALKAKAHGRTIYMRPWYEANGSFMNYYASPDDAGYYRAAYHRVAQIFRAHAPAVKMELGAAASNGTPVSSLYPTDPADVDVLSIDFYNNYPWCTTSSCFADKIENAAGVNSLADLTRLGKSKGDPVMISEWSNQGKAQGASTGGGGESPQFMTDWFTWLTQNAGTGPGQVLGEIQFNLYPDQFELFDGHGNNKVQPLTAQRHRDLW